MVSKREIRRIVRGYANHHYLLSRAELQFKASNLSFNSTSYEWLVIAGARAQYKGEGTINGSGVYGFLLIAIDGEVSGGGAADRFRIKIWLSSTGAVVHDYPLGDADHTDAPTTLDGGIIISHMGGGNGKNE